MLNWLFKPVKKIGDETIEETVTKANDSSNLAEEILAICDIDALVNDPIKSRVLLCMNTDSIEQLFNYMVQQKDIQNHSQTAVSISNYFSIVRISPSECFLRLSKHIKEGNRIPAKIKDDLLTIKNELSRLNTF